MIDPIMVITSTKPKLLFSLFVSESLLMILKLFNTSTSTIAILNQVYYFFTF